MTTDKVLELRGVQQRFHARGTPDGYLTAVADASFRLAAHPPQVVSLVGQSGSGKSTIARNILGLQKPTAGTITYGGKDIFKLSRAEYDDYRRDVQPVFQDPYCDLQPLLPGRPGALEGGEEVLARDHPEAGLDLIEESLRAVGLRPGPECWAATRTSSPAASGSGSCWPASTCSARPSSSPTSRSRCSTPRSACCSSTSCSTSKRTRHDDAVHHPRPVDRVLPGRRDHGHHTKGQIVERGPVADVMTSPTHPYTQASCSTRSRQPDPDQRWTTRIQVDESTATPPTDTATEATPII